MQPRLAVAKGSETSFFYKRLRSLREVKWQNAGLSSPLLQWGELGGWLVLPPWRWCADEDAAEGAEWWLDWRNLITEPRKSKWVGVGSTKGQLHRKRPAGTHGSSPLLDTGRRPAAPSAPW